LYCIYSSKLVIGILKYLASFATLVPFSRERNNDVVLIPKWDTASTV